MNEAEYLMKNYGDLRGCYPPRPTASTSKILHMIRKPNSLIVLLIIQNNSLFKKILTSIDPSMLSPGLFSSANILQIAHDCRTSSGLFAVLAMFLDIILPGSYSWNEWNVHHFCFHNQNNSTSSPGLLG